MRPHVRSSGGGGENTSFSGGGGYITCDLYLLCTQEGIVSVFLIFFLSCIFKGITSGSKQGTLDLFNIKLHTKLYN